MHFLNRISKTILIIILILSIAYVYSYYTNHNEKPDENPTPPPTDISESIVPQTEDTIRLALPSGIYLDACEAIESEMLTIEVIETNSTSSAISSLLDETVDLALLTPQYIAELYRAKQPIQVLCVMPTTQASATDNMLCLAGRADYLSEHANSLLAFLSLYEAQAGKLTINWDMLDLVQAHLETQYSSNPDANLTVPDGAFYFIFP